MGGNVIDQRIIPWKALTPTATVPAYGSAEAAGADLHADTLGSLEQLKDDSCHHGDFRVIRAGERLMIKTNISIELPPGTYAKIEGRSGLALKHGIAVLGGVIDSDYRGGIGVILLNTSKYDFTVKHGDRIAQLVIQPYVAGVFQAADKLEGTERGEGGFGSTGV